MDTPKAWTPTIAPAGMVFYGARTIRLEEQPVCRELGGQHTPHQDHQ